MTDPDLIQLFIAPLEELEIRYMITGGVAAVIYGDPRFTRDIDVVLELRGAEAARLAAGFPAAAYDVPPPERLERETARPRGGFFRIRHRETALRADIYLRGDDPLHAWAFERRERLAVEELEIWVAPVEYVIVRKLQYSESSGAVPHLRDAAMMLRISGDAVDRRELRSWVDRLELHIPYLSAQNYDL